MRMTISKLWLDDAGFIASTELVLVATLLVIGVTVGHTTLRDAVVAELADTAEALQTPNQSYSYSNATGHSSSISGTFFTDEFDFCENVNFLGQHQRGGQGVNSAASGLCISFTGPPSGNG